MYRDLTQLFIKMTTEVRAGVEGEESGDETRREERNRGKG